MSNSSDDFLGAVHSGGQNARGDVAADVAAGHGQGVEDAARMDPQADLGRPQRRRAGRPREQTAKCGSDRLPGPAGSAASPYCPRPPRNEMSPRPTCARSTRSSISVSMSWMMALVQGLGAAGLPGVVDAADDVGAELDLGVVLGGGLAGSARRRGPPGGRRPWWCPRPGPGRNCGRRCRPRSTQSTSLTSPRRPTVAVTRPSHCQFHEDRLTVRRAQQARAAPA